MSVAVFWFPFRRTSSPERHSVWVIKLSVVCSQHCVHFQKRLQRTGSVLTHFIWLWFWSVIYGAKGEELYLAGVSSMTYNVLWLAMVLSARLVVTYMCASAVIWWLCEDIAAGYYMCSSAPCGYVRILQLAIICADIHHMDFPLVDTEQQWTAMTGNKQVLQKAVNNPMLNDQRNNM